MRESTNYFDISNFSETGRCICKDGCICKVNKIIPGYFKSETGALEPEEFMGLKPKMYSLRTSDNKESTVDGFSNEFVGT